MAQASAEHSQYESLSASRGMEAPDKLSTSQRVLKSALLSSQAVESQCKRIVSKGRNMKMSEGRELVGKHLPRSKESRRSKLRASISVPHRLVRSVSDQIPPVPIKHKRAVSDYMGDFKILDEDVPPVPFLQRRNTISRPSDVDAKSLSDSSMELTTPGGNSDDEFPSAVENVDPVKFDVSTTSLLPPSKPSTRLSMTDAKSNKKLNISIPSNLTNRESFVTLTSPPLRRKSTEHELRSAYYENDMDWSAESDPMTWFAQASPCEDRQEIATMALLDKSFETLSNADTDSISLSDDSIGGSILGVATPAVYGRAVLRDIPKSNSTSPKSRKSMVSTNSSARQSHIEQGNTVSMGRPVSLTACRRPSRPHTPENKNFDMPRMAPLKPPPRRNRDALDVAALHKVLADLTATETATARPKTAAVEGPASAPAVEVSAPGGDFFSLSPISGSPRSTSSPRRARTVPAGKHGGKLQKKEKLGSVFESGTEKQVEVLHLTLLVLKHLQDTKIPKAVEKPQDLKSKLNAQAKRCVRDLVSNMHEDDSHNAEEKLVCALVKALCLVV